MCAAGRAGGRLLSVSLQTRPPSQAPQEAAPVKGLRCAAPWSSAPQLPLRRARFPPGAGLRFDGSGPARLGWSQRWTGHHCCLKLWKAAKGECPGHLRLVRPAAAGALCVFTPRAAGALLRALPSVMVPAGARPAPTRPALFLGPGRLRLGSPGRRAPSPRALGVAVAPRPRGSLLFL